ncbi:MAG: YkvA family protein [Gammaproteobacteria bacterium]
MQPTPYPGLGKRALRALLERVLRLYYTVRDPATPRRAALVFTAAVVYLLVPLDFIPDLLPLIGLADDATGLLGAAWLVSRHTKDIHRRLARERANRMLGILENPP